MEVVSDERMRDGRETIAYLAASPAFVGRRIVYSLTKRDLRGHC
jgi:hypothetical protein